MMDARMDVVVSHENRRSLDSLSRARLNQYFELRSFSFLRLENPTVD